MDRAAHGALLHLAHARDGSPQRVGGVDFVVAERADYEHVAELRIGREARELRNCLPVSVFAGDDRQNPDGPAQA